MNAACLNKEIRNSNLQQNKTKAGNSSISLKLPQRFIRMQKPLPKVEENNAVLGQPTAQEGGAETRLGD